MEIRDTILLVDDTASSRSILRGAFEGNYNLLEAENGEQALLLLEQNAHCITAILLDLEMPLRDGYETLKELKHRGLLDQIPVVAIAEADSEESELRAFELGAIDVITRPFRPVGIQKRVRNIVELYYHRWNLEEQVEAQAESLRHSNEIMVDALSALIEYRSAESGQHILRIRRFTRILLEEVARHCPEYGLTERTIQIISSAAALHDIGKISIPDSILNKPGGLTDEEYTTMKSHAAIGSQMLETLSGAGNEEYLRYAYNICRYHHERWDGGGYPDGLVGDEIPICAQTVGLADVYDALTTNRVYKDAYSFDTATNMILNGECGTFSPKLLECFKRVRGEFERLARSYADGYSPKSDAIKVPLPGPDSRKNGLDTLQMVQVKCQLLLHYLEVTAVEVDLDHGVYHLLYNPNPDLAALGQARTFPEAIERLAQEVAHPDDRRMITEGIDSYLEEFFASGLRRHTRRYRLFNQMREEYQWYNVVVLRIDMAETESRKAIILWAQEEESARQVEAALRERTPVTGFLGIFQCCRNDRYLTMKGIGQGLISLLGYTEEEINTRFHGRMIELLLPETRERVLTTLREQLIDGNTVRLEMQMRHKNGSVVCMLAKAYLALGEDGAEYFYGLLVDITETKASQERLRLSLERHRIIMDQTNDIVFEWDMREDTLVCSPKWKERFGYEPFTTNVTENLIRASHWHPEDVQIFVEKVQSLRDGANYVEAEVRIANSEGRYLWNRIRVTGLADGQGNVTRAVGVIINIDREKRAAQKLMDQVERDSLTGLLNKAASRRQMEEYLASRNADSYSALLIIDLDNFKAVNDRYGHMFGDEVLMKASQQISGLFRAKDVIARIGGDEFMVFMQDIPGRELVRERCESLKEIFQRLYREELAACGLSCSIGVACAPEHGSAYQELFQRADIAMYQAKGQGKNCFVFYDEVSAIPADFTIQRKRIDSDDQPGMASNMLVPYVFRRLYESGDMDKTIQDVLGMVGQQMNVSRVYIFENTPDDRYCSNTFEWCSAGIPPEINNLQLVSYETDIPGYQDSFDERGIFYCPDVSKLPQNVQEILEPQGIRSMLQCAIRDNGTFKGYVGFDECNENRLWTKDQIELLTYLSQVMSVFLMKKRAQDACAKQEKG